MFPRLLASALLLAANTALAQSRPTEPLLPRVSAEERDWLANRASEFGFELSEIDRYLEQARRLPAVRQAILPAADPGVRSWSRYRARFVEARRIEEGRQFWQTHRRTLARAQAEHGVPAEVIVAIIGVETFYGRVMGNHRVLDSLATLGFDWPEEAPRDRSAYFREQWLEFLRWSRIDGIDPTTVRGSFAGAIGLPQFMPGNIHRYGQDGDGDGHIDLRNSPADAILSVGRFLREHGWQRDLGIFIEADLSGLADPAALVAGGLDPTLDWPALAGAGALSNDARREQSPLGLIDLPDGATGITLHRVATPNFFAITRYNRSYFYAAAVADLAAELALQPGTGDVQLKTPVDK